MKTFTEVLHVQVDSLTYMLKEYPFITKSKNVFLAFLAQCYKVRKLKVKFTRDKTIK